MGDENDNDRNDRYAISDCDSDNFDNVIDNTSQDELDNIKNRILE